MNQVRQFKASVFQALAHPTRLQVLEVLRDGELSVGAIRTKVQLDQANLSQHLAKLRLGGLVANRKEGNQVFYSIRDKALIDVLDILKRYFYSQLSQTMSMLKEIKSERPRR